MKKLIAALVAVGAGMVLAGPAAAATVTLEGGATNEPGHVKLVSDTSYAVATNDYSTVLISDLNVRFSNLRTLSAEFNTTDDGCAGGSPRLQLHLDDGTIVHVALGTFSSTTGTFTCSTTNTWESSGNLVGQLEGCRWHSTGTSSDACLDAAELAALAARTITAVRVVADGGWAFADKEQTVLVRKVMLNRQSLISPQNGGGTTKVNPARACRALQASMTPVAFRAMWQGVNANGANAFGKCVSTMAKADRQDTGNAVQLHRAINADVRACRAAQRANPTAFRTQYGARGVGIGKCVLAKAKTDLARLASTKTRPAAKAKGARRP